MTTAHRPTWKAAVGKSQEGGWSSGGSVSTLRSILDAPSHTKLKVRHPSQQYDVDEQARKEDILKVSLKKLQAMEEKRQISTIVGKRSLDERVEAEGRQKLLKATADVDDVGLRAKYDDADDDCGDGDGGDGVWSDVEDVVDQGSDLDASDSDDDSGDSDDEDSEDEEAALQAELAKIRKERENVKAKVDAEVRAEEQSQLEEAALIGNPLLNAGDTSGKLKRRWNDDVVFRNQAKGEPDQGKKRFINDTVRNDFHKRFLNKFVL